MRVIVQLVVTILFAALHFVSVFYMVGLAVAGKPVPLWISIPSVVLIVMLAVPAIAVVRAGLSIISMNVLNLMPVNVLNLMPVKPERRRRKAYETARYLTNGSNYNLCHCFNNSRGEPRRSRGRSDLRHRNALRIPRLEVDLRGPRRGRPSQFCCRFGQRCRDQGLPRRAALVPGRHNYCCFALSSRSVRGK